MASWFALSKSSMGAHITTRSPSSFGLTAYTRTMPYRSMCPVDCDVWLSFSMQFFSRDPVKGQDFELQ